MDGSRAERVSRRSRARILVGFALVLLSLAPLAKGTLLWSAPYGDSHDGRNGSTWAAGAEELRDDPLGSRLGAVRSDGTTYANHPPGILLVLSAAEVVGGDRPAADRGAVLLGLWAAMVCTYVLLRRADFEPVAALAGVAAVAAAPMTRVYGTMVDTPTVAFPFAVATIAVAVRLGQRDRMRPWELAVLVAGPLLSWQLLLLDVLVLATLVVPHRRRHLRPALLAVLGGTACTAAWLLWVHGSFDAILDQFRFRSSAAGDSGTSIESAARVQLASLRTLLGPVLLLVPAAILALRAPGPRRIAAGLAGGSVLLYCVILSNGASNHDYWSYWGLLTAALAAAVVVELTHQALAARIALPSVRIPGAVAPVALLLVAAYLPTTTHERVGTSSAEAGDVLRDVDLPPGQQELWLLAEFGGSDRWVLDAGIDDVAHLTEERLTWLRAEGRSDEIVVASTSCDHPAMACDRLPFPRQPYAERRFVVLRIGDLEATVQP